VITSIDIKNFQSHKQTHLDFGPGINAIVGMSDSGKSSVLRALRWVCTNKPSGLSFIRHGEEVCEVSIFTSEGAWITRTKGKGINQYEMDGKIFEVPKTGVPEDIEKVLNMGELNWQAQHDSPFLLSESPGEVSRMLNRITNLETIDSSLGKANSRRLEVIRKHSEEVQHIGELEEEIKKYSWIDECHRDLRRAERVEKNLQETMGKGSLLEKTIEKLKGLEKDVNGIRIPSPETLKRVGAIYRDGERGNIARKRLETLVSAVSTAMEELKGSRLPGNIDKTIKKMREYQTGRTKIRRLSSMLIQLDFNHTRTEVLDRELKKLEQSMPDICPLCGGKL